MLFGLRNFLKISGVFRFEHFQYFPPKVLQILINTFFLASLGSFIITSVIYSLKYQNLVNTIKTAGYSTNNQAILCANYIYLLLKRAELWALIEAWEETIQNSFVSKLNL